MVDHDALLQCYEDLGEALLEPYDIGEMLYRITDQVVHVLGIDGAGISLARDGQALTFVTASDRRVAGVEDHQVSKGEGPCQDAFATGRQVHVADLRRDPPWPGYAATAMAHGLHAVAGLPMPVSSRRIGAMDLYRAEPGPWAPEDLRVAQVLANMTSGYILHNMELSQSRTLATQLQEALDSRIIIEQAKGIVAARHEITPNAAFERLRRLARNSNRRLHQVCRDIVAGDLDGT